jgi:hypothetical protein
MSRREDVQYAVWLSERSVEVDVAPESIWRLWSDISTWGAWEPRILTAQPDGPFAVGTTIALTHPDAPPSTIRVAEVIDGSLLTVESELPGGVVMKLVYRIIEWAGHTRASLRVEIAGPGSDAVGDQLGPMVVSQFPESLDAVCRAAKGLA